MQQSLDSKDEALAAARHHIGSLQQMVHEKSEQVVLSLYGDPCSSRAKL